MTKIDGVVAYHQRTKHYPNRFARSAGYLDWDTQPNPFRRYEGARLFELPFMSEDPTPRYESLFDGTPAAQELSAETLGLFLEMSLGISAWKEQAGARWALRCNPSSGNLHPTEGYVVAPGMDGLHDGPGVYHYAPKEHGAELRAELGVDAWGSLSAGLPRDSFLCGLTSIYWREAWKYGERAFRYCQHDVGHAMAALGFAGAALGWRVSHLSELSDAAVSRMLGIDRDEDYGDAEREHPDGLFLVVTRADDEAVSVGETEAGRGIDLSEDGIRWHGRANVLSGDHVEWAIIDSVAEAAVKGVTETAAGVSGEFRVSVVGHGCELSAKSIVQQRRSAVDMDGKTSISRNAFYTMLERTMPRAGRPPWTSGWSVSAIHLGLFVHRVEGLEPGLYALARDSGSVDGLRSAMDDTFLWESPVECPDGLPLFALSYGDCRRFAVQASCGQAIAGDSAFSLGMFAEFDATLRREGASSYRRLFWEAGMIGQVLYLEAEAAGIRATGIGCYFDDVVHDVFGLRDTTYQSMYHFTVGGPVEDNRLSTLPPYSRERRARP